MIARSTGANLRSFFESPKFIATFLHEKNFTPHPYSQLASAKLAI